MCLACEAYIEDLNLEVCPVCGEKIGFMNERGDVVIPPAYSQASRFYNGKALVRSREDDCYYFIDRDGNRLSERICEGIIIHYHHPCSHEEEGYFWFVDSSTELRISSEIVLDFDLRYAMDLTDFTRHEFIPDIIYIPGEKHRYQDGCESAYVNKSESKPTPIIDENIISSDKYTEIVPVNDEYFWLVNNQSSESLGGCEQALYSIQDGLLFDMTTEDKLEYPPLGCSFVSRRLPDGRVSLYNFKKGYIGTFDQLQFTEYGSFASVKTKGKWFLYDLEGKKISKQAYKECYCMDGLIYAETIEGNVDYFDFQGNLMDVAENVQIKSKDFRSCIGRRLAAPIHRVWIEDFQDEDSGEVVPIERKGNVAEFREIISEELIQELMSMEGLQQYAYIMKVPNCKSDWQLWNRSFK